MMARPSLPNEAVVAPAAVIVFFVLAFARSWFFWLLAPPLRLEAPVTATALPWSADSGRAWQRWPWSLTKRAAAACVAG